VLGDDPLELHRAGFLMKGAATVDLVIAVLQGPDILG
jgi:hypothetical protein